MAKIPSNSFTFGSINSWNTWGIKVIAHDAFGATKRERKQTIPYRHGFYDYGEKYYDSKIITLDCATENGTIYDKSAMREVIYHMEQRSLLRLWDEPDKYYIAELMESSEWTVLPKYCKQQFTLSMVCQPFAYGEQITQPISNGVNRINYKGTAETPTLITLRNPNDFEINNITITMVRKRKTIPRI